MNKLLALFVLAAPLTACHAHTSSASAPLTPVAEKQGGLGLHGTAIEGAPVHGSLPKEAIRLVVRDHLKEVEACYAAELPKTPALAGRVMVQFIIAGSGSVLSSMVQESTLNRPTVETCVKDTTLSWKFPKPDGGGIVIVSYPFSFRPR